MDAQCIRALIWGRYQWRIQHFPGGGDNSQSGCTNLFFGRKLYENERGERPWCLPLDPPLVMRQVQFDLTGLMLRRPLFVLQVVCNIYKPSIFNSYEDMHYNSTGFGTFRRTSCTQDSITIMGKCN